MRFYRWLKRHGMRPEDYDAMFEAQGGLCAICGQPPGEGEFLQIDHDHGCCDPDRATHSGTRIQSCGKCRRGLLCRSCNLGLGCFGDDADRVLAAAAYLLSDPATRGVPSPEMIS